MASTGTLIRLAGRVSGRYQRTCARYFAQRPWQMQNVEPLISFTFDDFPRSALFTAGPLLERHGASGTYYASLGLTGQLSPTGEIVHKQELPLVLERGHEFGCHTFSHCDAGTTPSGLFEQSIVENQRALGAIFPGVLFKTLSYPIGIPRPDIKRVAGRHFLGCRAGGQTSNSQRVDLNFLSAFFIEQSRDNFDAIQTIVEATVREKGWLIFATHDVCDNPTRFGCRPEFFERVVECSVNSGARIVTVSAALDAIGARSHAASARIKA